MPNPASRARTIASARSATCNFASIAEMWLLTVLLVIANGLAIWCVDGAPADGPQQLRRRPRPPLTNPAHVTDGTALRVTTPFGSRGSRMAGTTEVVAGWPGPGPGQGPGRAGMLSRDSGVVLRVAVTLVVLLVAGAIALSVISSMAQ